MTARDVNPPLSLDDRIALRGHTKAVIQNVLFQRAVLDSMDISEQRIQEIMPQFNYDLRLRTIVFSDRATAERVRREILRGRMPWSEAVRRYSRRQGDPQGDLGWVQRHKVGGEFGVKAFTLAPGGTSEIIETPEGYHLVRCLERRPAHSLTRNFIRNQILNDLQATRSRPLTRRLYQEVRAFAGVVYDTANIVWAANKFKESYKDREGLEPGTIDLTDYTPDFPPADTGRVLARTRDRTITLGQFIDGYATISVLSRQDISSFEPFIYTFDGPAFENERVQLAYARGIDKDSMAVAQIEAKKEEVMVAHLYQDSVVNRVVVTPDMRRDFYRQNEHRFVTFPRVRTARFLRANQAAADSLMARLRAGEKAERIMESDSLRGDDTTGTIYEVASNEHNEYKKILFEELRPGEVAKVGPDKRGQFYVFQLLEYFPERKLSYQEVQGIIDESVQNSEAERLLEEFLERRRSQYHIQSHPELVMRIDLKIPAFDKVFQGS